MKRNVLLMCSIFVTVFLVWGCGSKTPPIPPTNTVKYSIKAAVASDRSRSAVTDGDFAIYLRSSDTEVNAYLNDETLGAVELDKDSSFSLQAKKGDVLRLEITAPAARSIEKKVELGRANLSAKSTLGDNLNVTLDLYVDRFIADSDTYRVELPTGCSCTNLTDCSALCEALVDVVPSTTTTTTTISTTTTSTIPISFCDAGEIESCNCPSGRSGSRTCLPDGSGFNECACAEPLCVASCDELCGGALNSCGEPCNKTCATPTPPEVCDGQDNDGDGLTDEIADCWVAIYRFKDPTSETRCWSSSSSSPPPTCSGFKYEREAWIASSQSRPGTFSLSQCSYVGGKGVSDHILVPTNSKDFFTLQNSAYNCQMQLGYVWPPHEGPTSGLPFGVSAPVYRLNIKPPGVGHLFTVGLDALGGWNCETPAARFDVITSSPFSDMPQECR